MEINAVRTKGTYKDTRMTLTQLYAQDRRRLGDTNGDNQAALPPFFVCIAPGLACFDDLEPCPFNLFGAPVVLRPVRRKGDSQQLTRVRTAIERNRFAAQTAGMAKKPQPPKPICWKVDKIASKAVWLGDVEARDEATAMDKASAEFKVPANRLMAIRR
jgi:hypothetical protein